MTNYFSRRPSHASAIPARRAAQQQQQLVEAPLLAAKAGAAAAAPPAAAAVAAAAQRHRTAEVPPIISPVFSPNLHSLERLRGGHLHPIAKHHAVPAVRVYRPGKKAAAPQDAAPAAAAPRPAAEVPKPAAAAAAAARPPPPVVATAPRRRDKQRGAIGAAAAAAPLSIRIRRRLDRFIDGDMAHLRERATELLGDNFVATIPARIAAIPRAINTSESLRALGQAALIAKGVVNKLASDAGVLNAPRRRFIGTERGDLADSRSRGVAAAPRQQREPARVGARHGRAEGAAFALSPALQLRRLAVRLARRLRHAGALSNLIANLPNLSAAARAVRRGRAAANVLRSAPAAIAAALLVPAMRAAYVAGTNVNVGRTARGFAQSQLDAPLLSLAPSLGGLYRRAARAAMAQLPVNNNTWFQMLARPVWAMSPRAADMVWTAAVACMAVACYRLLTAPAAFGARVRALFAFGLQLAFCASCGLATIALRSPVAGLVHHLLFAGAVARSFITARRVDKIAAAALAPVVGLILYECAVQAFVVAMN